MPYQNEYAARNSQVATATDPLVAAALARYSVSTESRSGGRDVAPYCRPLAELAQALEPDHIAACVSVDGSFQETPIAEDGGRRLTVGYVRVGTSTLDLGRWRRLQHQRTPIDPAEANALNRQAQLNYALPGVGMDVAGQDPRDSWRDAVATMLTELRVTGSALPVPDTESISLAEVLLLLHGDAPGRYADRIRLRRCPTCGAAEDTDGTIHWVGPDGGACTGCGAVLYLADVLGLDEMLLEQGRDQALRSTMNTLERLVLIGMIELMRRHDPAALASTLLVADGPLAAIGPMQRLTRPLVSYLDGIATDQAAAGLGPLLLTGVEKDGNFVAYGHTIADLIAPGQVMRLPTDYIARHITGRSQSRGYGAGHMYGRRFFYRRTDGQLLTVTVPAAAGIAPWSPAAESEQWSSYPTLRTVLEMLESLVDRKHPDAVLPLTFAHQVASLARSAALPLAMTAQGPLGLEQNTRFKQESRW